VAFTAALQDGEVFHTTRTVKAEPLPPHRFLREVFRHYLEYRDLVANGGDHVLEHSYYVHGEDGEIHKETLAVSFWDLHRGLKELAPRKREAIFYNVILDQKQKDVAARMGITTVSVGQYVDAGMRQLVKRHFPELDADA
jgi:DNA-directed RNA polymerase specialized sigma24 family protein